MIGVEMTRKSTKQSGPQLWTGSKRLTGNKSKAEGVGRSLRRRDEMYRLMAEHPESVEELAQRVRKAGQSAPLVASKVSRVVRKAEKSATDKIHAAIRRGDLKRAEDEEGRPLPIDPGTGPTVIKMRKRPIPKLVDEDKIGREELSAAEDILTAYTALTAGLLSKGINYDRVDNGIGSDAAWPVHIARAVQRYQDFAKVWTQRNQDYCDPTLAIVIDAVVDQRWVCTIASDHGYRVQRVERAIIGGLRDYAARAGFVTGHKAQAWQDEAAAVFGAAWHAAGSAHQGPAEYRKAIRRAAVEK